MGKQDALIPSSPSAWRVAAAQLYFFYYFGLGKSLMASSLQAISRGLSEQEYN